MRLFTFACDLHFNYVIRCYLLSFFLLLYTYIIIYNFLHLSKVFRKWYLHYVTLSFFFFLHIHYFLEYHLLSFSFININHFLDFFISFYNLF